MIFFIFLCLLISLVSFMTGLTMGWMLADNQRLKSENLRWNLINQTVFSNPD